MGIQLKTVKVIAERYHIYEGNREQGDEYDAKLEDAIRMKDKGLVKMKVSAKIAKPSKED